MSEDASQEYDRLLEKGWPTTAIRIVQILHERGYQMPSSFHPSLEWERGINQSTKKVGIFHHHTLQLRSAGFNFVCTIKESAGKFTNESEHDVYIDYQAESPISRINFRRYSLDYHLVLKTVTSKGLFYDRRLGLIVELNSSGRLIDISDNGKEDGSIQEFFPQLPNDPNKIQFDEKQTIESLFRNMSHQGNPTKIDFPQLVRFI